MERSAEIGQLDAKIALAGGREAAGIDEASVGHVQERPRAIAHGRPRVSEVAVVGRAAEVEWPASDVRAEDDPGVDAEAVAVVLAEVLRVLGKDAELHWQSAPRIGAAEPDAALEAEGRGARGTLHHRGEEIAGQLVEAAERLVVPEREGERVARLVGQEDVGQLDARALDGGGEVGFDPIAEVPGQVALHAEEGPANFGRGSEVAAGNTAWDVDRPGIDLQPPARFQSDASGGNFREGRFAGWIGCRCRWRRRALLLLRQRREWNQHRAGKNQGKRVTHE